MHSTKSFFVPSYSMNSKNKNPFPKQAVFFELRRYAHLRAYGLVFTKLSLTRCRLDLCLSQTFYNALLNGYEAKRWELSTTAWKSSPICRSHVWVDPLPTLDCIINALLHRKRTEWQSKEPVYANSRFDHALYHSSRHTALMAVAEGAERDHRGTEANEPRRVRTFVIRVALRNMSCFRVICPCAHVLIKSLCC